MEGGAKAFFDFVFIYIILVFAIDHPSPDEQHGWHVGSG